MRNALTMRFRLAVAAFVQAQARDGNRSVTNFVERLLLREKAHFGESQRQLTVRTVADLLRHERHDLVRDADEGDGEHAARSELFETLLDHPWLSACPRARPAPAGLSAADGALVR